jgi:hypothetical protein
LPPGSTFRVYAWTRERLVIQYDEQEQYGGNDKHNSITGTLIMWVPRIKVAKRPYPIVSLPEHMSLSTPITNPVAKFNLESPQRVRFLVVLDFEATCDFAPQPIVDSNTSEIIEFPWVVLDTQTLEIVYQRQVYVRPDNIDGITKYCTGLTGITKEMCQTDSCLTLAQAVEHVWVT